jgi:hypothetical protein
MHQQLLTDGAQRLERLTFLVSGSLGEELLSKIIGPGGRLAGKTASGGRVYLEPSDQGRSAFIELIRIFREKGGTF